MDANYILINKIISKEWDMFTNVNKGLAVADCQEDPLTFNGMRKAQFSVWSNDALQSYLNDLNNAENHNRNLMAEKYIHMMKKTAPTEYIVLLRTFEFPGEGILKLAEKINKKLMEQTKILHIDYSCVTSMGRPLESTSDDKYNTSIETYQLGELFTYSEKTLDLLKKHIDYMDKKGVSFAQEVLENTVNYWGYDNLETAETAMKRLLERE